MRLEGKVAIVTGGGSGIGTAYCRRFLAEGTRVMIAGLPDGEVPRVLAGQIASVDRAHTRGPGVGEPFSALPSSDLVFGAQGVSQGSGKGLAFGG